MSLSDIENMLPYEFMVYISHISSTIEEYKKSRNNNNN